MRAARDGAGDPCTVAVIRRDGGAAGEEDEGVWKRTMRAGDAAAMAAARGEPDADGAQRAYKMLLMYRGYREVAAGEADGGAETLEVEGRRCRVFAEWMDYREVVEVVVPPRAAGGTGGPDGDEAGGGSGPGDATKSCSGLRLAVRTMEPFERALVTVSPSFGYGSAGNFSFPHIPPDSWLVYEVAALNWEPIALGGLRSGMVFEGRLRAAEHHRSSGNEHFRAAARAGGGADGDAGARAGGHAEEPGSLLWAKLCYSAGLSYFSDDVMMQIQDSPRYLAEANALRHPLLLNLAACNLMVRRRPRRPAALAARLPPLITFDEPVGDPGSRAAVPAHTHAPCSGTSWTRPWRTAARCSGTTRTTQRRCCGARRRTCR